MVCVIQRSEDNQSGKLLRSSKVTKARIFSFLKMACNSTSGDNQSGMSFQIVLQTGCLQVKQPQKWHITQKTNCNLKQTEFFILHYKNSMKFDSPRAFQQHE
jgi:hypothetical protein